MRIHEIVWSELLPELERFGRVSPACREILLPLKGSTSIERDQFGADAGELIDAGLLAPLQDPSRVRLAPAGLRVTVAVRAVMRWPILFDDSRETLRRYVQENFSPDLRETILWDDAYSYSDRAGTLAERAGDSAWIERTLAEDSRSSLDPALRERTALMVESLIAREAPVPIAELSDMFGADSAEEFDALAQAAFRNLILFPGLDPETEALVVGLAPQVHRRLARKPAAEAAVMDVALPIAPAFAALDLNIVLAAIAGGTVRVRANDGSLYKRDEDALAAQLTTLDAFLDRLLDVTNTARIGDAIALAHTLALVEMASGPDGRTRLVATAEGRDWLATDYQTRATRLLELIRPVPDARLEFGPAWRAVLEKLGWSVLYGLDTAATVRVCSEELARMPREGGVRLREFIVHAARERNPFQEQIPDRDTAQLWRGHPSQTPTQDGFEELWAQILLGAIAKLLWPWGGLRTADVATADGEGTETAVALTPVGAYLLGLEAKPPAAPTNREQRARVIVQPTFEITFLDPDPEAESELASFCQRIGGRIGVLFRITKDSVARAAAAGTPVEMLMETLARISSKPIPPNVTVEVRSWHGRQRTLTLDRPWILHCGDAETAARVLSEAPRFLERLSDTVLALRGSTQPETVAKALAKHGITIDVTKAPPVAKTAAKRRTRRRRYR